jgi:hypothetical protein
MSLLKTINEAANTPETEGTEAEAVKQEWLAAGGHRTPEKVYQLLLKILKDESKVHDAFKSIGISFKGHDEAADVLEPHVAKDVAGLTRNMTADQINHLINIVRSGQMPG